MKAFFELMRPVNCLMASMAAIIGLLMAGGREAEPGILIFLAVFLVTGAGNATNDYFDREIDAVNRPKRPIPSGRASLRAVQFLSGALFASGCILAGVVSLPSFAIASSNSALLYLYGRKLKGTPLAGNLCVSYLTGSAFLFGGSAYGMEGMISVIVPALLSFLATMSREIVKDVEDMRGDRLGGAKTMPLLAGERAAGILAGAFAVVAVLLSYQPGFGTAYLAIMALADISLLASVGMMAKGDASGAQRALKLGMAAALMAFLAAALLT